LVWIDPVLSLRKCENFSCPYERRRGKTFWQGERGLWFQGQWHCSRQCFQQALLDTFTDLLPGLQSSQSKPHRIPLGVALLSQGLVTDAQLKAALENQGKEGGRLGIHLQRVAGVSERELTVALAKQLACPVVSLSGKDGNLKLANLVPLPLLEAFQMVPVHYSRGEKTLQVAFRETIDDSVLGALEAALHCRVQACVAESSALEEVLENIRQQPRPLETVFENVGTPEEMAGTTAAHVYQARVREAFLATCGKYIWVRLRYRRLIRSIIYCISNS
jgi:hypothetical protein